MNHFNYKSLALINVNISSEKALPVIHQHYHTKFAPLPYAVPVEYTIVNFMMEKLHKFKRINFEDLLEYISKLFCVEAINGTLIDSLLKKRGAELKDAYLTIA